MHHKTPHFHHKFLLSAAAIFPLFLTTITPVPAQTSNADLQHLLQNPPDAAKPMVRWWWFGSAVEKPEILRELQQMKADGIGGAELAFVYPEVLDSEQHKNLPFLSPEMLDCVKYAQQEARKLGLRVDVTMGSGWPYGGPEIPLTQAATRLKTLEIPIPTNATTLPESKLSDGDTILSTVLVDGEPRHWNPATAHPLAPHATLTPSSTLRTALIFIQSHTNQQVKRAAVGAEGYVLDPFSHEAVANHLHSTGEPLLKAFGTTPPYAIFSDSLEAYGADWTPNLPQEFKKRRGYDLLPHLPELVAGGTPAADNIRHDYGITLTELVNENYLTQINDWAKAHNTKFRSQTYGEPAVSFSSQNLAALPEGEGPQWRAFSTLRWATSANHVFGNNVTSGETFTWLHSPVFRATPLDMKAEADIDFIMGENQLIFHGWPYSPPASELPPVTPANADPGWSLYAAAVFNDHNPWHPVMPAVDGYIARVSALLRQGQPANQVAILLPTDDAWASFYPGKVTVTGAMQKLMPKEILAAILSAGYNFDFIDAEAIDRVGLGTHKIVLIPPTTRIPLKTLQKLDAFARTGGGKVLAIGTVPTLDADGKTTPELEALLRKVPFVGDVSSLATALQKETTPDLQIASTSPTTRDAIGFIRRTLPNADIYFVANTHNTSVDLTANFATPHPHGQQIDPDTLTSASSLPSSQPIHLAPYESRIFLFTDSDASNTGPQAAAFVPRNAAPLVDIANGWSTYLSSSTNTIPSVQQPGDWAADPATRNYSGEVVYTRDFTLTTIPRTAYLQIEGGTALPGSPDSPPEHAQLGPDGLPNPLVTRTGPGMHAYYDPPIREAALVTINGRPAGALWHPPYSLDVSRLLKPGQNQIEIRVYNTALNAWAAIPPHDYKPLIAKYGDRFQMQDLNKVEPLPSGILGTIHLVTEGGAK